MIVIGYIDPGSGSLLIQSLIAGALAIPFFFRNAIARGVSRLRGENASESEVSNRDQPAPDDSATD